MPTARRRFSVTETEDVARALDAAATTWPEAVSRSVLLRRLIELGSVRATELTVDRLASREAAMRSTSGIVRGVYPRSAEEWTR